MSQKEIFILKVNDKHLFNINDEDDLLEATIRGYQNLISEEDLTFIKLVLLKNKLSNRDLYLSFKKFVSEEGVLDFQIPNEINEEFFSLCFAYYNNISNDVDRLEGFDNLKCFIKKACVVINDKLKDYLDFTKEYLDFTKDLIPNVQIDFIDNQIVKFFKSLNICESLRLEDYVLNGNLLLIQQK